MQYYGSGFYWGIGFHVAPVFYLSGFHWHNRHVVVIPVHRHSHSSWTGSARDVERRSDAQRWQHDSRHRRGVEYRSPRLNRDYGRSASPRDNERRGHERRDNPRERDAIRRENPRRPDTDGRREPPRPETRSATGHERDPQRRGSTRAESNGPRERELQAQGPRREPAPEDARGHRNERASTESRRNSRGEDGGRGPRQRRNER